MPLEPGPGILPASVTSRLSSLRDSGVKSGFNENHRYQPKKGEKK